jgi:hypothetical protein
MDLESLYILYTVVILVQLNTHGKFSVYLLLHQNHNGIFNVVSIFISE